MTDIPVVNCPHCGESIGAELTAKLRSHSEVTLRLTPMPGEYMTAKTIGQKLTAMEGIFDAAAKAVDPDMRAVCLLRSLTTDADGTISATMMIARAVSRDKARKSVKRPEGDVT